MYRRRRRVNAVKLAPAEHYKDRSYLVRIESTAASTAKVALRVGTYHVTPTTSEFTLTATCRCGPMSPGLCLAASLCYTHLKQFKDDQSRILECERCEGHCCAKCVKLNDTEYDRISARKDFRWYCAGCESKVLQST